MTTITCDLTAAVELARLAPSVHNTQPWRFRIEGDALVLGRDSGHRLPALDPSGRQQVLSCGAALHLARLALRLQGFDSAVTPLAPLSGEGPLARLVPVAGHRVRSEDVALAAAARTRHTPRGPYRAELAGRTDRPAGASVGMPAAATPDVHPRASNLRLRDFRGAAGGTGSSPAMGTAPPEVERPLALVLRTGHDAPADWLRAGSALMAVLLRAALDGVQAQSLGQVIDHEWTRARLGAELDVVGHPQMVLRMGYGHPGADTPRRSVTEVLG